MAYELPKKVPAWKVKVYCLPISMPLIAARVGWQPSSHRERTFRSIKTAQRHGADVEARAVFSLIPIKWRCEIEEVTRDPDVWDKLRAKLNMRPIWEL